MIDPIIEAAARAIQAVYAQTYPEDYPAIARAVLAAVTPMIEAAALERAARAFEADEDGHDIHNDRYYGSQVAAALRALKERP